MEDESMHQQESKIILQAITRHVNCLSDDNRSVRKRAIESINKEIFGNQKEISPTTLQHILDEILKPVLSLLLDPVEKCRELCIGFLESSLEKTEHPQSYLSYMIPIFVQRLGQVDIVEPSEEIRLQLVGVMFKLVSGKCNTHIAVYVDDYVQILSRTITDQYPEVRKESCRCASTLAKAAPQQFHMQSESLIKPLLLALSHQHSKVRVEVVKTIGVVCQYGNGKSVDDVISHLAQRLFDQSPVVRSAVICVVGGWLLDLMDRYSYFHKLIPLLLTGLQDDVPDIKSQAEAFWHDVGLKFERENEQDLKDKLDFVKETLDHYPPGLERPNLGCRELMYNNFSKILSGLVRDICDWVVDTRIKSSQLLYEMLINEEGHVTQHLNKVLDALYKACHDDEKIVVKYAVMSAELIGFFVHPDVWCKMILQNVKLTQSKGSLMVLAGVIRGSRSDQLQSHLSEICNILLDPLVSQVTDSDVQTQLLSCVSSISLTSKEGSSLVGQELFNVLVTIQALSRCQHINAEVRSILSDLALHQGLGGTHELYERHTRSFILTLKGDYASWSQHSVERVIFDSLLLESGPVVGGLLEDIIPIIKANLHPDKDAEVRLKFFNLLSRLVLKSPETLDSQQRFAEFAVTVVRDMVLPNMVWRAGKTAAAINTTAVSCLWALLESGALNKAKIEVVMEDMMTQILSSLENDNKQTRLISCRIITKIFTAVGTSLERHRLHNIYPELLKRLDDSSDDVRIAVTRTFLAYFKCFEDDFEAALYRAHLEAIYQGLLLHMDDPESKIQDAVLDVLIYAAKLMPAMLANQVESVRFKHRNTIYIDKLTAEIRRLQTS